MKLFFIFPLLFFSLVTFALFNQFDLATNGPWYENTLIQLELASDDILFITSGQIFLIFSFFLLNIELIKATHSGQSSILNHIFSVLIFVICLFLLLMGEGFGNSMFLFLTLMTFTDFLVGFIISIVCARRDFGFSSVGQHD